MKPFYRMLTRTTLVLQSLIILYLLSSHHEDNPKHTETFLNSPKAGLCQGGASFNKLSTLLQFSCDSIKTLFPCAVPWNHDLTE